MDHNGVLRTCENIKTSLFIFFSCQLAVSVQYSRMYNIEESRMYSTYDYIALTGKPNVYIRHFSSSISQMLFTFLRINLYSNSAEYYALYDYENYPNQPF